jgi:membrane protein DedA with SNARE-associated domain
VTRRRAETLCLGGLAITTLYTLALIPVAPSLLGSNPVLLELLRGSTPAMVAGGAFARVGQASLLLALVAPVATLMMADPFLWWAGRIWGPKVAGNVVGNQGARGRRWTERATRWSERYGSWAIVLSYVLPVPSALIYAAAGWTGMRLRRFLVLDLIGVVLWVLINVGLGYAIGQSAVDVAKAIGRYSLYVTIGIFVIIFAVAARRSGRERAAP